MKGMTGYKISKNINNACSSCLGTDDNGLLVLQCLLDDEARTLCVLLRDLLGFDSLLKLLLRRAMEQEKRDPNRFNKRNTITPTFPNLRSVMETSSRMMWNSLARSWSSCLMLRDTSSRWVRRAVALNCRGHHERLEFLALIA